MRTPLRSAAALTARVGSASIVCLFLSQGPDELRNDVLTYFNLDGFRRIFNSHMTAQLRSVGGLLPSILFCEGAMPLRLGSRCIFPRQQLRHRLPHLEY